MAKLFITPLGSSCRLRFCDELHKMEYGTGAIVLPNRLLLEEVRKKYANVEAAVNIGGNNIYNAFVGPFYYFYCDLNWTGVAVFSLVFGYFSERLFVRYSITNNIYIATAFLMPG